jgi:shikimate dehydrogenase
LAFTYGLIGRPLEHSFSPQLHKMLGDYSYELRPLEPDQLENFLLHESFLGVNVTIPYKKAVIPYCARLTERAQAIGSVNTLVRQPDGSLLGDNTDLYGLQFLARQTGVETRGKKVLILGSGGASLTAQAAARLSGAREIVVVSRQGPETYENLAQRHLDAQVLINATPVGMYPHAGQMAADPAAFPALEGALDLIYNPLRSAFVQSAQAMGVPAQGGLAMLAAQAKAAAEVFTGRPIGEEKAEQLCAALLKQRRNIALVGMPGAGKTTVGALLAQAMGRPFIDLDQQIEQEAGMSIPQIFERRGEAYFRDLEAEMTARASAQTGCVVAAGGGAVLRPENRFALRQNSFVLWLQRDLDQLATQGRPLSAGGTAALARMLEQRGPLYQQTADCALRALNGPEQTAQAILEVFYETACR